MPILSEASLLTDVKRVAPEHLVGDLILPGHPLFGIVWINPQRVSGTPCFFGTRVPLQNLFDYLEGGHTPDDFLDGFPGVTREQSVAVLQRAHAHLRAELPTR